LWNNKKKLARIIAIDYGKKRTGLAVTDPLQIIATGLTCVETREIFNFLDNYIKNNEVEQFVVGLPKQMDNTPSQIAGEVEQFIKQLINRYHKPVETADERFTSKLAFRAMIDGGLKQKARRNKALIDEISATIILQSHIEKIKH